MYGRSTRSERSGQAATPEDGARSPKVGASTLAQQLPYQEQMEQAFGEDFSSVTVAAAPGGLSRLGATGAAAGETVAFADASPSPWLVAHELAHVVQHRRAGGVAPPAAVGAIDSAPEHEASAVADRVTRGEPAGEIRARPAGAIQRFAPEAHQAATVNALAGSFSAEEIGEIYASNWERDFSQGASGFATAVLAWKAVKNHAATHRGDPGPTAEPFRQAVLDVVNSSILTVFDTSLGGY